MNRQILQAIWIGLAAAGLASLIGLTDSVRDWENSTWSWRVKTAAAPSLFTPKIKIITIDEASLDWGEEQDLKWPWPRPVYNEIIDFCQAAGVKVLAFDMLFFESLNRLPQDDIEFAKGLQRGVPTVGAITLLNESRRRVARKWPGDIPRPKVIPQAQGGGNAAAGAAYSGAQFPATNLALAFTTLGNVTANLDADGGIRRVWLVRQFAGVDVPALSLAAARTGGAALPEHLRGEKILRFRGVRGTHQNFSARDIINSSLQLKQGEKPDIDPAKLNAGYVFFGVTAKALHDNKPTPVGGNYPGIEVHATALDNLLAGDFIRPTPPWVWVLATMILSLLAALIGERSGAPWQSVLSYAVLLPLPGAVGVGLYEAGYWWPVVAQTIGVLVALTGALVLNFATAGKERRFIKQMFSHYLSPHVVDQLIADPSRLTLGGEKRELSIFFSDLQGFTTISESMDPQDLAELLNDYLNDMTTIILEEGGTLDKYEGDAIIAFWNAPLDVPGHALCAARAALRCQQKLAERREEFFTRTGQTLLMRIGVHTGVVSVGNFGSRTRFDYTMLGDAANLAARLEGANKVFGSYTMVSEATWTGCHGQLVGRELGALRVVGRSEPVRVFEPIGLAGESLPPQIEQFTRAFDLYQQGKWDAAGRLFARIENDPPAAAYAKYCANVAGRADANPGGVWEMTQK